ncbi:MAG: sigma-70 family RNA polymerase sigma factor [Deltaproteobacteria bacterium]|nr:sigma-70 family RNA polymerase sigma factor [Deltaproteobacteria bacterium]
MEAYEKYGPALLRKCERILRNKQDAEDVVQGLFLELIEKETPGVELPYLYRACTNRCLNLLRNRKKRRELLERSRPVDDISITSNEPGRPLDMDILVKLIGGLDKKSREIFVYRFLDDMDQEEIAWLLGTTRKTVFKHLKKIRSRLNNLDQGQWSMTT